MAVSKIRKISSWTLILVSLISLAFFGLFFFGGVGEPYGENQSKTPIYTGELLYWAYALFAICAAGMLLFGIVQFGSKFKTNPKGALVGLGVLICFAVLLVVAFSMGDGTLLTQGIINQDSQKYNTEFWLKTTDMWLYSIYMLAGLAIIAMLWGSVKKILSK